MQDKAKTQENEGQIDKAAALTGVLFDYIEGLSQQLAETEVDDEDRIANLESLSSVAARLASTIGKLRYSARVDLGQFKEDSIEIAKSAKSEINLGPINYLQLKPHEVRGELQRMGVPGICFELEEIPSDPAESREVMARLLD